MTTEQKLDRIHRDVTEAQRLHAEPTKALAAYGSIVAAMDAAADQVSHDDREWLKKARSVVLYNSACMHGVLGEKEKALGIFKKSLWLRFDEWDTIAKDRDGDLACLDKATFDELVARAKRLGAPLTIQRVIDDSILQDTLTEEGIDNRIGEAHRERTVFHHEWVRSPELKGLSCLMIAGDRDKGGYMIHDIGGKTLFLLDKIDGSKLEFIE